MSNKRYSGRLDKKSQLFVVVDNKSKDIVAYIPNGKMRLVAPAVGECADCVKKNRDMARTISGLLNAATKKYVYENSCGRMRRISARGPT